MDLSAVAVESRSARHRTNALVAMAVAGAAAAATALLAPEYRALVAYGLYAVPAHLLISFMPHEPYILYAGTLYAPPLVAAVGTSACLVAIAIDYWMIGWVVRHRLVAPKLDQSKAYKTAERWFGKAPFLLIVATALAPVPFYPTKILAITSRYPIGWFMAALVLGRFPRFWFLAFGGQKVQAPGRAMLYVAIGLGAFAAWRIWVRWREAHSNSAH